MNLFHILLHNYTRNHIIICLSAHIYHDLYLFQSAVEGVTRLSAAFSFSPYKLDSLVVFCILKVVFQRLACQDHSRGKSFISLEVNPLKGVSSSGNILPSPVVLSQMVLLTSF